jgi:NlpC/P60 family putative phage cell wall peptidase
MPDTRIAPTRAAIVAHARTWIGTPYHHQASRIGAGTDCLGFIRGIYRALHGREAQSIPGYARDWAEGAGEETMLAAARQHLVEIAPSDAAAGDILIFRYRQRYIAKHAAILVGSTIIHAIEGAPVCEVSLTSWWRRRIAGAFSFPGVAETSPAVITSPPRTVGQTNGE